MTETALRFIGLLVGALARGLFDYLLVKTGRWALAVCGIRSNIFVETLVGILTWVVLGLAGLVTAAGIATLLRSITL
jgi:hypothetical protein